MIICQTFFSRCSNCPASKTLRRSSKVSPNGAFNICHEWSAHRKWDMKSENIKTGGTNTRPPVTLITVDL